MSKYVDANNLAYYHSKIYDIIQENKTTNNVINVELGTNGQLGGYKTGDTIAQGTNIEMIIKKLLAKQIPPTYTTPTVQITNYNGTASGAYEYGTLIIPKIKITFTQKDGGSLSLITVTKNNIQMS
jgi:hypothetical protein